VKNGSKILFRWSGGMPGPVSPIDTRAQPCPSRRSTAVRTRSVPPSRIASSALVMTLSSACWIWGASADTSGSGASPASARPRAGGDRRAHQVEYLADDEDEVGRGPGPGRAAGGGQELLDRVGDPGELGADDGQPSLGRAAQHLGRQLLSQQLEVPRDGVKR